MNDTLQKQRDGIQAVKGMDAAERARYRYEKNKPRNDAYSEKVEQAKAEEKIANKPAVKRCMVTVTVVDQNGEHSNTWAAHQLTGTIMPSQRNREWYMNTAKEALQKHFGKLT